MSRGDDLRAAAEAADREDELASAYEEALANYRDDPEDEVRRNAFKGAANALAGYRSAAREAEGREGVSVAGDAMKDEE